MTDPQAAFARPSALPKALFVARYGHVWENSPWIAGATFDAGLTDAHDSAEALHAAMTRVVRAASPDRQRALLLAHPDLAGKLAVAGELTPDSTHEQASAGLDRLTTEERARFTALNDAYKARFGIPFIIAVRGLSKAEIVQAFERRLASTHKAEFETALAQVEAISLMRLRALMATG